MFASSMSRTRFRRWSMSAGLTCAFRFMRRCLREKLPDRASRTANGYFILKIPLFLRSIFQAWSETRCNLGSLPMGIPEASSPPLAWWMLIALSVETSTRGRSAAAPQVHAVGHNDCWLGGFCSEATVVETNHLKGDVFHFHRSSLSPWSGLADACISPSLAESAIIWVASFSSCSSASVSSSAGSPSGKALDLSGRGPGGFSRSGDSVSHEVALPNTSYMSRSTCILHDILEDLCHYPAFSAEVVGQITCSVSAAEK